VQTASDVQLKVTIREMEVGRKRTEHSVWVERNGHTLFCAHPATDHGRAIIVARAMELLFADAEGRALFEQHNPD